MAIFSPDARSNLRSCISFMCQISLVSFNLEQFLTKPFFFFLTSMTFIFLKKYFTKLLQVRLSLSFLRVTLKQYTLGIKKRALQCPSGCCGSENDHLLEVGSSRLLYCKVTLFLCDNKSSVGRYSETINILVLLKFSTINLLVISYYNNDGKMVIFLTLLVFLHVLVSILL